MKASILKGDLVEQTSFLPDSRKETQWVLTMEVTEGDWFDCVSEAIKTKCPIRDRFIRMCLSIEHLAGRVIRCIARDEEVFQTAV